MWWKGSKIEQIPLAFCVSLSENIKEAERKPFTKKIKITSSIKLEQH